MDQPPVHYCDDCHCAPCCCADDEEMSEADCYLMPDGQCLLAGSEHCDWDCGRLNEKRIAAMKRAQQEPTP